MIIYNVTSQVTPEIEKIWIEWMEKYHLPKVFATNYFEDISILKVSVDQPSDPTFAVQYKANSNQANPCHVCGYGGSDGSSRRQRN